MTYYTLTTQIKGMTKSDQLFTEIRSESGKICGHLMARLHLLRYHFQFDQCGMGNEEDAEILELKNKKLTVVKSYRLKLGIMLTINLN